MFPVFAQTLMIALMFVFTACSGGTLLTPPDDSATVAVPGTTEVSPEPTDTGTTVATTDPTTTVPVETTDTTQQVIDPATTDDDGDGFSEEQGDCNDADAAINPKAKEDYFKGGNGGKGHGDGVDNDCDGKIDETICACGLIKGYSSPANATVSEDLDVTQDDLDSGYEEDTATDTTDTSTDAGGKHHKIKKKAKKKAHKSLRKSRTKLCTAHLAELQALPAFDCVAKPATDDMPADNGGNTGNGDTGDDAGNSVPVTDADGDHVTTAAGDCDDTNKQVYPGHIDCATNNGAAAPGAGIDNDCDGTIDEDGDCTNAVPPGATDADGDHVTVAAGDCNDNDKETYPGHVDCLTNNGAAAPGAGVDNDCDGTIDEDGACTDAVPNGTSGGTPTDTDVDADGDHVTVAAGDCNDNDKQTYPGHIDCLTNNGAAAPGTGVDNDCDGTIDDDGDCTNAVPSGGTDADGDHVTVAAGDCNDNNKQVYPGHVDCLTNNGSPAPGVTVDNDCDGAVDEDGDCTNAVPNGNATPAPAADTDNDGDHVTVAGGDCNDADPQTYPGHIDCATNNGNPAPGAGVDNDCDGSTDEDLACTNAVPTGKTDADGDHVTVEDGDCNDSDKNEFPHHTDCVSNNGDATPGTGNDNDCDTAIDEDGPCTNGVPDTSTGARLLPNNHQSHP
jgi:hypothetical protein